MPIPDLDREPCAVDDEARTPVVVAKIFVWRVFVKRQQ
jgi:hypothetical protein